MIRNVVRLFCVLIGSMTFHSSVGAQQVERAVIQSSGAAGFNRGPVMPTGLSVPARMANRPQVPSGEKQIRINLRYIMLDTETRRAMYKRLGAEKLKTTGNKVPVSSQHANPIAGDVSGQELIAKSSHVTTCVLAADEVEEIVGDIVGRGTCSVIQVPSVILINGQEAQITDLIQRPFVVDLHRQTTDVGPAYNTITQVLDEGTSIELTAKLTPTGQIRLESGLRLTKIIGLETEEVFGVADHETKVQVPIHQQKTLHVTENLVIGQTLMIDPYVKHEAARTVETGVPMFSKVPYVKKMFVNKSKGTVQQHMIVTLEPTIAKTPQPLPKN